MNQLTGTQEPLLYASARASVHFARACLEPVNGNLRSKSSFVDPRGSIMHWHDFGDLEGPGWAANAIGGALLLYRWGSYMQDPRIQQEALALVDHVLVDGFIEADGFIWPYYELARREFVLNYTHNNDWLCPGSLARTGSQMLEMAGLLPQQAPRAVKLRAGALGLGRWLRSHTPLLPDGWVPRRITRAGEPYPHSPTGGPDPIYDHSADGIFLLHLWAALANEGQEEFRRPALVLGETFLRAGGYWGSINHDTYDDHESVSYSCAYRILRETGGWLRQPQWAAFAQEKVLPELERFHMPEDRQGVATRGLLWMEETWDTAYLWENAEAAHAYLESWASGGPESHRATALAILRAIANHHYGTLGFLTEGVDWNNHVSRRHHVHERLYGAIKYTEPLLNNLHLLGPTLFYLERCGYTPPTGLDDRAAIELVGQLSAESQPPQPGKFGAGYYLRLYYPALETDDRLEQSLAFAKTAGVDGVLLFEASYDMDPALLTLEVLEDRFKRIREIAPRFHELGLEVHVNMMITLGHVDGGSARPERFRFQFMVNQDGHTSRSTACPLDPAFHAQIRRQYGLAADVHPQVIWVDDDTRFLIHDLPGLSCFCPLHLRAFSAKTGKVWTRQELAERLPDDVSLRRAWLDLQEETMLGLAGLIEKAVHEIDPGIRIGLMTVGTSFHATEGRHSDRLLRALAGSTRPVIRPGSGFWNDWSPGGVIDKSEDGARQVSFLGPDVQSFAEVENHPYSPFLKSNRILLLEMALDVLAGMPNLSLNLLTSMGGSAPLEPEGCDYAAFLAQQRPFLDALARAWSGKLRRGVGIACLEETPRYARWNGDMTAIEPRPWEQTLARLGLPLGRPDSKPHWISGEVARSLSGYELGQYLREGAVLDPIAAQIYLERGWGERLGLLGIHPVGDAVNELLSDDPRNGERSGAVLPVYNHVPYKDLYTWAYRPEAGCALSRWLNVDGKDRGPAALLLEGANELRVGLLPFVLRAPSAVLLNMAHRQQWTSMLEWAGHSRLPCRLSGGANLYPLCFEQPDDDKWLVALANLSADDAVDVPLALTFPSRRVERLDGDGNWCETALPGDGQLRVSVPAFSLSAWRFSP